MERCAIIGAGISGLSAAYFLRAKNPSVEIDLYEATSRAGGVIKSETISGCIVEGGPDSFLTMKKSALRLCQALGLAPEIVGSNDDRRKTYIFDEGSLKELPEGFFMMVPARIRSLVTTNLLSWQGKLEALSDLFCYPEQNDCAASDFLRRRFGQEVFQKIAEPLISGIYGANLDRLSVQSALPQIWEMQKKGSLILPLIRRSRDQQKSESLFSTLENGMESLVDRLQESSRASLKFGESVEDVVRTNGKWRIQDELYDAVLVAGSQLPRLDVPDFGELQSLWNTIRKNSAVVTVLAFEGLNRYGFGWLLPASQRRSVLACTYVSNKFPRRSPENLMLVRAFIGGDHATKWIECDDDQIRGEVLQELNRIAGIDSNPLFCRIFRWRKAMPEYQVGHREKIARIQKLIRLQKGLHLIGNVFSGVGIPDCIQHAENVISGM